MRRIAYIAPLLLLLPASLLLTSCAKEARKTESKPIVGGVKIQSMQYSTVDDFYEAVGTVRAKDSSVIAARLIGNVIAVHVREGDAVRVGQTLIEIENRDAGIQLQKSQAGVREAQNALEEAERSIHASESAVSAAETARVELAGSKSSTDGTTYRRRRPTKRTKSSNRPIVCPARPN